MQSKSILYGGMDGLFLVMFYISFIVRHTVLISLGHQMKRSFLSNIGKDSAVQINLTPLFLTNVIARWRVLLTSSGSSVKLQFSVDRLQQAPFDPCVLVVLISIRLLPTVRIT